jgi:hypothetical protein
MRREAVGKQGGSRGQKRAAKVKARQQRLAQEEALREQHARLVVDRADDPRFVQRRIGEDGSASLQWDPNTPAGRELGGALESQLDRFRQKFGREPGADDPVFFDPDADTPVAMNPDTVVSAFNEMIEHAAEAGIDPALLKASRDLGYIVTTENQHLFSAADVQAWQDAVESYQAGVDEDDGEDGGLEDLLGLLTDQLESVVAATVADRSAETARVFTAQVMATDLAVGEEIGVTEDDEGGVPGLSMAFAVLAGWLAAAREDVVDPRMADRVIAWIGAGLGSDCARAAERAAGILGAETAGDVTVQELADELQDDFLPVLIWLAAGVVAEYGNGNVGWLGHGEEFDQPDADGPEVVDI